LLALRQRVEVRAEAGQPCIRRHACLSRGSLGPALGS
jgi:hypothetical protein